MTFINISLAIGAAACVIPVVIHLLNRRRHRVVRWGAMHLISPLMRTNRRRIRMEQLILLLIRMALLALLALCMAGPVLTNWHALSGNAKSSFAILFDNSYSMQAGAVGATNLERAKNDAARLIEHQPRGSDVVVSLMAGGRIDGSDAPTMNRGGVANQLRQLPPGFGTVDVTAALEHATGNLAKMQHAKRDLVVISDFQAKDWSGDAAPALQRATQLINAIAIRPTVTLMKVGTEVTDNVSIQSIETSPPVVAVEQAVQIRVNLRNHGLTPYPHIGVNLQVDGADRNSQTINLPAGEDVQLHFEHTFSEPGSHVVYVRAEADTLSLDNGYLAVVPVWDRLPVLLVDGDPQAKTLDSETGFLRLALSPFLAAANLSQEPADSSLPRADLLNADVVPVSEFAADQLSQVRVLVLANVSRLDDQLVEAIKAFVRTGNSLLIFPGDQIDPDWYRAVFCIRAGMIPMTFDSLKSPLQDGNAEEDAELAQQLGTRIAGTRFDHPALDLFNDSRHGVLSEATFRRWYRLAKPGIAIGQQLSLQQREATALELSELTASTNVVARFDVNDPFLVESAYGNGRVIVCASACDDDWSNLPSRPFYLPLMQRLVTYLATAVEPRRNLAVGQTIVAQVRPNDGSAMLTRPDGQQVALDSEFRGELGVIEYADTDLEGLYTLQMASMPEVHYAVIAPREESELALLDNDALQTLAQSMDANLVQSTAEFVDQDSTRRYGREIWRHLFWALLVLAILEVLVQQAFAGLALRGSGGAG